MNNKLKLYAIEKAIAVGLIFTMFFTFCGFTHECESISNKVLRLHVLANSDEDYDQQLKLDVRDRILEYSKNIFNEADDIYEAENITSENINEINDIAQNEVYNKGYNYKVNTELVNMYFNTRDYGDITLPAGKYDALRITIGEAQGHNWWCVMFPQLCLPAATENKELSDILDENQMEIIKNQEKYEVRFKVLEIIENMKNKLES